MTYAEGITVMSGKKNPYLLGKHTDIIMDEMIWSLGFLQVNKPLGVQSGWEYKIKRVVMS